MSFHDVGIEDLEELSEVIRKGTSRDGDLLLRYGGELPYDVKLFIREAQLKPHMTSLGVDYSSDLNHGLIFPSFDESSRRLYPHLYGKFPSDEYRDGLKWNGLIYLPKSTSSELRERLLELLDTLINPTPSVGSSNKWEEEGLQLIAQPQIPGSKTEKWPGALFLDRDGVINVDKKYVYKKEEFEFVEGFSYLADFIKQRQIPFWILTNQSGVGRGYYTTDDIITLHCFIEERLAEYGIRPQGWQWCAEHENGQRQYRYKTVRRKPLPGMLLQAAQGQRIDMAKSIMIGDKMSDALPVAGLQFIGLKGHYPLNENVLNVLSGHKELVEKLKERL